MGTGHIPDSATATTPAAAGTAGSHRRMCTSKQVSGSGRWRIRLSSILLRWSFKNPFTPSPSAGSRWDPDGALHQSQGSLLRLSLTGSGVVQPRRSCSKLGGAAVCVGGGPSTGASPPFLSVLRRMVSLSPSTYRVWLSPASLSCCPRSPLWPGGRDGQAPRQELGPLPAAPLWTYPPHQGLRAPKRVGGLECTKNKSPWHECTRLLQGRELS